MQCESSPYFTDDHFHYPYVVERDKTVVQGLCHKGTNPIHEGDTSHIIPSQKALPQNTMDEFEDKYEHLS